MYPPPKPPSWCSYNKVKPRGSSDISATLLLLLQTLSFVGWLTCMSSWLFHNSLQTAGRKLSCRPKCYIGGSFADAWFLLVDAWICCVPIGRRHRSTVQWLACRHMLAFKTFKMDLRENQFLLRIAISCHGSINMQKRTRQHMHSFDWDRRIKETNLLNILWLVRVKIKHRYKRVFINLRNSQTLTSHLAMDKNSSIL